MRAVDQERGPGWHLAVFLRFGFEIADQVAGAGCGFLGPGHAAGEAGDAHFEVALVFLEDCEIAERGEFALGFAVGDVLAAGHEVKHVVGEEIEPGAEFALVQQPGLAGVERHQF